MNHEELFERIKGLLPEGAQAGYFLEWARDGRPVPTYICLLPRADGTVIATQGDLRTRAIPVLDENGQRRVFSDEANACEWAWEMIVLARASGPPINAEQRARNLVNGDEQRRLMAERLRRWEAAQSSEPSSTAQ